MTASQSTSISTKLHLLTITALIAVALLAIGCGKVKKPLIPQASDVEFYDYVINSINQETFALKGNCLDEDKVHIGSPFDVILECTDNRFQTIINVSDAPETEWVTPIMARDGWVLETRNTIKRTTLPELATPAFPSSIKLSEQSGGVLKFQGTCSGESEAVIAHYLGLTVATTCRDSKFYFAVNLSSAPLGPMNVSIVHQDPYGNLKEIELNLAIDQ